MNAKETRVRLIAPGFDEEFEFSHAERILQMPNNGGWHLPDDSPYEFKDNAIISRGIKREAAQKPKKRNTR